VITLTGVDRRLWAVWKRQGRQFEGSEQGYRGFAPCTKASFQDMLIMFWTPVFMPCAPDGLWMCALSPPSSRRPTRSRCTMRLLIRNQEFQVMS